MLVTVPYNAVKIFKVRNFPMEIVKRGCLKLEKRGSVPMKRDITRPVLGSVDEEHT